MGEVSRLLGRPLMPWQQYVADVALEIDPDTGRLAYQEIGLTVPRQSGKSTLILAKAVHRASASGFFGKRQKIVYTAQTRQKAKEKWEEDYAADLESSRTFAAKVHVSKGGGNEHIRFLNGSRFGIESNTEKAGHGGTIDEAYIDEAFSQPDARLEQAFRPAMITRANKQLWWVSTAGWLDGSPYLEGKARRGREQVESGSREGLAYFEWSAPADADPQDRGVWWECMPALGWTITEDAIQAEYDSLLSEGRVNDFCRAYLNQWVAKDVPREVPRPISLDAWRATASDVKPSGHPVFFVTVAEQMQSASIAVAALNGRIPHVELADHRPGINWVTGRLRELSGRHPSAKFAAWAGSPLKSWVPTLREHGVELRLLSSTDNLAACSHLEKLADDMLFTHSADPVLVASLEGARKRDLENSSWKWDWRNSEGDLAPLAAVTGALWLLELVPSGEPGVYVF